MANGYKVTPRVAVLWNGVTLEELGIANLLLSADLTMTIGRSSPTRQMPLGKPKIGGASVTFLLPDPNSARRIQALLYKCPRPFLALGFGYHGSDSYWLGGGVVRTKPDMKKFATVSGYKIDTVAWKYAESTPTVTLNGLAGRVANLNQYRKASVWSNKSLADIAKGIADEQGVVIRISGSLPANKRIEHAVQGSNESRLDFLDRVSRMLGGSLHTSTMIASAVPGASKAYDYVFEGRGDETDNDHWATDQEVVRTILTIKSIEEEFKDVGQFEQAMIPQITWAAHLQAGKNVFSGSKVRSEVGMGSYLERLEIPASSVSISEDNYQRTYAAAATLSLDGKKRDHKAQARAREPSTEPRDISTTFDVETGSTNNQVVAIRSEIPGRTEAEQRYKERIARAAVTATPAADLLGGKEFTEAQLRAATVAMGIKTRLNIEMATGWPELVPGMMFELLGTYTHDDYYGIEEVRNSLTRDSGLKTSVVARRLNRVSSKTGSQDIPAWGQPASRQARPGRAATPNPVDVATTFDVDTLQTDNNVTSIVSEIPRSASVPAASSEAALSSEIDASLIE